MGPLAYLLKLAGKNIRRNSGRTFFIGLSVAMSVSMAVWIMAFFDGLNHQIEEAVVKGNVGFFQLQENHFSDKADPAFPIVLQNKLTEALSGKHIISYSPELVLDAYLTAPEGNASFQLLGVDFQLSDKVMKLSGSLTSGTWPTENGDGIVIGQEIAKKFLLKVGDTMVINYQDINGELRSELLPVLAIFHKNGQHFERSTTYVSQKTWQKLFFNDYRGPLFHRIVIMTPSLASQNKIAKLLQFQENTQLKTWKNINPEMGVVLDFHAGLIRFFFLIVAITVTVTILTPVSMLWQERLKEIRMMSTIGVPQSKLWLMGMLEAGLMVLLSCGGASIMLVTVFGVQIHTGIDFGFLGDGETIQRAGIDLPKVVFPIIKLEQGIFAFTLVLLVMAFSYAIAIRATLKKSEVQG